MPNYPENIFGLQSLTVSLISLIIAFLSLIFIISNFFKMREPVICLEVRESGGLSGGQYPFDNITPSKSEIYYKNLSDKFVQDLKICWNIYLFAHGGYDFEKSELFKLLASKRDYKIISGELMSGGTLTPRDSGISVIDIHREMYDQFVEFGNKELLQKVQKISDLITAESGFHTIDVNFKLSYSYKFFHKFTEDGSFYFLWTGSKWKPLREKTKLKHWWQLWGEGSALRGKKMRKDTWIALIALIVSIVALVISVGEPLHDAIFPADTIPLTPSSFGIINGVSVFPSHHILLPIEWYNSWKVKPELISQPYLVLHKNGSNTIYYFSLVGEYSNISIGSFNAPYNIERTFMVPPNSISKHTLVFRTERGWDPKSPLDYSFKFVPGEKYKVDAGYLTWNDAFQSHKEIHLFNMTIRDAVANISEHDWNTFDLNRITGEII